MLMFFTCVQARPDHAFVSFYGTLAIGTPPFAFDVLLDTGSAYVFETREAHQRTERFNPGTFGLHHRVVTHPVWELETLILDDLRRSRTSIVNSMSRMEAAMR